MEKKEKSKEKSVRIKLYGCAMALLAAAFGAVLYMALKGSENLLVGKVIFVAAIVLAWVILDVVTPRATGEFAGKNKEQMDAYKKMAALDAIGYAGLAFFMLTNDKNTGFYGAIAFAATVMIKKQFREVYYEDPKEDTEEANVIAADTVDEDKED